MKYLSYYRLGEFIPYKIEEANNIEKRKISIKKASVFFGIYNKQDVLAGTIYSIARQLTIYNYELCIVDDCSDEDPKSIVKKYAPDAKYFRYDERQGFDTVYWDNIFKMVAVDSEVIIIQSADVIWSSDSLLNIMIDYVDKNRPVLINTYNSEKILEKPNEESFFDYCMLNNEEVPVIRCNQERPMYPFLMAIMRTDLEKVITGKPMCDVIFHLALVEQGMTPLYISDPIAIHQPHSATWIPCKQIETCTINCKLKRHFEDLNG